ELEGRAGPLAYRLEDADGLGDHFLADAVARQNRDTVRRHLGPDLLHALRRRLRDPVERAEVGPGARLDDVGRGALAGHQRAVEVDLHGDLADRILAGRRRAQRVVLQSSLHARDRLDRRHNRVDRAVAYARVLE